MRMHIHNNNSLKDRFHCLGWAETAFSAQGSVLLTNWLCKPINQRHNIDNEVGRYVGRPTRILTEPCHFHTHVQDVRGKFKNIFSYEIEFVTV